jgi:hypothetical protein
VDEVCQQLGWEAVRNERIEDAPRAPLRLRQLARSYSRRSFKSARGSSHRRVAVFAARRCGRRGYRK